jgi:hypothetical protein
MSWRFWQRLRSDGLLRGAREHVAYFGKAVAAVYLVREHLVELTVVSDERDSYCCCLMKGAVAGVHRHSKPPSDTAVQATPNFTPSPNPPPPPTHPPRMFARPSTSPNLCSVWVLA